MAYTTATLTGTYYTLDGSPAVGTVEVTPNSRVLVDSEGDVILSGSIEVALDAEGSFSVTLPATDDATVEPASNRQYRIAVNLQHRHFPPIRGVELAGGTTVDMADLTTAEEVAAEMSLWLTAEEYADDLAAVVATVDDKLDAADVDAVVAAEVADTASQTRAALTATYAARGPAFEHLRMALDGAGASVGIQVLGDSTGNETGEWVYLLGQHLATAYPAFGVRHRLWNDTTQRYGAPTVIQAPPSGYRHTLLSGGFMRYDHAASNSITGDLDVSAKVALNDWTPAADSAIVSKFGGSGTRQWRFYVNTAGRLVLQWSPDGAFSLPTATSTVAPTVADGADLWVRATLDVDNGASGYDVKFYTSADGATWTQLGTTITAASVTSIFAGTAQLEIGSRASGSDLLAGKVYEVYVRNGIDGPTVVPVLPESWRPSGAVSNAGSPVIDIVNGSVSGMGLAYFNDATREPKMTPDLNTLVTFLSTSHNDGTWLGPSYLAGMDALFSVAKARQGVTVPVVVGQNPRIAPSPVIAEHATRIAQQRAWAQRNGAGFVNVYDAFINDGRLLTDLIADGLHPSAAGSQVWRDAVIAEAGI